MLHLSRLCGQKAELLLGTKRRQREMKMKLPVPTVGGATETYQMMPSELPMYLPQWLSSETLLPKWNFLSLAVKEF